MGSYVSVEVALEDWFEKSFDELPEELGDLVERAFRPDFGTINHQKTDGNMLMTGTASTQLK